jgi:hypothetical protein
MLRSKLLTNILSAVGRRESDLSKIKQKNLKFQTVVNIENSLDAITLFICYCNRSTQDRELFLMCNIKNLAFADIFSKFTGNCSLEFGQMNYAP